ncbi:MAG: branched-chain amino acid transaminase, partial [Gammaproteobacteria bacterium]
MTMANRDGEIWLDGAFVPWREAQVHVLSHTLHYGMGVFEGLRAYPTPRGPAIFRLEDHIRRLFRSAHILGMAIPYGQEVISRACCEAIRRNHLESAYIRPMCFYGPESMGLHAEGLKVHAMVAAWSWGTYMGKEGLERGIRVKTASIVRHHHNSALTKAKANGNYLNSMVALQEAVACGYDEALLLDVQGFVAEGSGENIFIVRNGELFTPDLSSALEGITRDTIFALAAEIGIPVQEKRITRDEVYIADEAFFTGTAAEIVPIRELDGRAIGSGERGPVTERLQALYFDQVHGRREAYPEWLTY